MITQLRYELVIFSSIDLTNSKKLENDRMGGTITGDNHEIDNDSGMMMRS